MKYEPGQIQNAENFPTPNELVCIQVPKVFDQTAMRDCQTVSTLIYTATGTPTVTYDSVQNFNISNIKVLSKTDSMTRPGYKKLKLQATLTFDIYYSVNGVSAAVPVSTSVVFNLTVNEIYCPSCTAQIGFVRYPNSPLTVDVDGTMIKVEAIAEAFNDHITIAGDGTTYTYTLAIDIGAFFIIKCECEVQLLIPAYGYCPVPPEQTNTADLTCCTFRDRRCAPFPNTFYPDQKQNILDATV